MGEFQGSRGGFLFPPSILFCDESKFWQKFPKNLENLDTFTIEKTNVLVPRKRKKKKKIC
jgi:hypothetical protein